eukprot:CFRG2075T1
MRFLHISFILGVCVLAQAVGVVQFLLAYFPSKPPLSGHASAHSAPAPPPVPYQDSILSDESNLTTSLGYMPKFGRLVFVVVDALRSDFLFEENSPFIKTRAMLQNGMAQGYIANARMPTVTLPRLKALITGGIPGFIDLAFNLDSSELMMDNLMYQLKNAGKRLVHFGDDTWLKMLPSTFHRSDGTNSFFVADYTEVDNNVTRHLDEELVSPDWDVMVLHYLGVDHIGHLAGQASPLLPPKLREMDHVIQLLSDGCAKADEANPDRLPTLIVALGDHGMTQSGNHGGNSDFETSTALLFLKPVVTGMLSNEVESRSSERVHMNEIFCAYEQGECLNTKVKAETSKAETSRTNSNEYLRTNAHKKTQTYSSTLHTVDQTDIVPTISALFGIPIPQENVGMGIAEILTTHLSHSHQHLRFTQCNTYQMLRFLDRSGAVVGDRLQELIEKYNNVVVKHAEFLDTLSVDDINVSEHVGVRMSKHIREHGNLNISPVFGSTMALYMEIMSDLHEEALLAFTGYNETAMCASIILLLLIFVALLATLTLIIHSTVTQRHIQTDRHKPTYTPGVHANFHVRRSATFTAVGVIAMVVLRTVLLSVLSIALELTHLDVNTDSSTHISTSTYPSTSTSLHESVRKHTSTSTYYDGSLYDIYKWLTEGEFAVFTTSRFGIAWMFLTVFLAQVASYAVLQVYSGVQSKGAHKGTIRGNYWMYRGLCTFVVGHGVLLFSTSFVEEEHEIVYYVLSTVHALQLCMAISECVQQCSNTTAITTKSDSSFPPRFKTKPTTQLMSTFKITSTNTNTTANTKSTPTTNTTSTSTTTTNTQTDNPISTFKSRVSYVLCHRLTPPLMLMGTARVLRTYNQTGDKWKGNFDGRLWLIEEQNCEFYALTLVVSIVTAALVCAYGNDGRTHTQIRTGRNENTRQAKLFTILQWTWTAISFMACALVLTYHCMQSGLRAILASNLYTDGAVRLIIRNTFIFFIDAIAWVFDDNLVAIARAVFALSVILIILTVPRAFFLTYISECSRDGTIRCVIKDMMCVLMVVAMLVHRTHNLPLLPLQLIQFWAIKAWTHNLTSTHISSKLPGDTLVGSANSQSFVCKYIHIFLVVLTFWLGRGAFYQYGNSGKISAIDISGAYTGLTEYGGAVYTGSMTLFITYTGVIMWSLAPLLLLQRDDESTSISDRLVAASVTIQCIHTYLMVAISAAVLVLRHHLFAWSVMAPRYLYMVAETLVYAIVTVLYIFVAAIIAAS